MSHHCKFPSRHELIARGVIIKDGAILVNRGRNAKTGAEYFALPGGHIDPGESSHDAVQRELVEELQAEITAGDLLFVSESIYPGRHEDDGRRHEIVLYFQAELTGGLEVEDGRILSPEADKNFQWLPLEKLAEANMLPRTIKQYLLGDCKPPARFGFSDDT